ncbi:MAG: LemA family protein [Candidatus Micrarchaeota archaeon]|nr:LemA family protein [Candidatus Micrarchaeota archaeon]MDE1859908.1 LemA family protein [Candidatus Micrarchaeota archaeon]
MGLLMDIGIAVIVILALIILAIIGMYNGFIQKRNRVQDAWAQIDVQLKRRYDLIPNLVNTVKGYRDFEKSTLTQVTALRAQLVSGSVQDKAQANNMLSQTLKSLFAVSENYPDLKASENFKQLQTTLEDTEDKISFVRTSYNDYVLDYNNAIQQFPGNFFASTFHFARQDFFQAPDEEREPVNVDFNDSSPPAATGNQKGAAPKAARAPKQPKGGSKATPPPPS